MANRLISRQKFIPGGFLFYIPPLKWKAPRNLSFDQVVQSAIHVLKGNPAIAAKLGWDLSYNAMADRVDEFNAKVCEVNGWVDYISGPGQGGSIPKPMPQNQAAILQSLRAAAVKAKELVAGAKSLMEWDDSGQPAVSPELSEHRAIVCTACPKNEPGKLTEWFTIPAAELIKRRVERAQARNLRTPRDEQLHTCTACACPLKLKVHVPIEWIAKRLTEEQKARLREGKDCWILSELERQ